MAGEGPLPGDLGEFPLIERLARRLARQAVEPAAGALLLGIGDDAALLRLPEGAAAVATADMLVEGVHFRRDWSRPEEIGWKALAVNVSDLNAMGAQPVAALVCLALPGELPVRWVERCYAGLAECAGVYGCPVAGGDTVRSPGPVVVSVSALGAAPAGRAVRRTGARPGDVLCVTGVLGASGAGCALLERGLARGRSLAPVLAAHRRPRPPRGAGAALAAAALPTAMLDLSDGLASDAQRLATAGGVGLTVEADRLPISDATRRAAARLGLTARHLALHGGEDFELLFTVPPERWPEVPPLLGPLGVTATIIGQAGGRGVWLREEGRRRPLRPAGFQHFPAAER